MPARTRKIRHDDETRARIQAALIINRFTDCVMGNIQLDPQQVSCGKALLNKVLPDLASVDHSGELTHNYVAELPATATSSAEWLNKSQAKTIQ